MTTLMEKVANERRRLRTVRQKLTAAVGQGAHGDATFLPFYVAAVDYLDAAMQRLHAQDVKMGDMIREKAGTLDAQAKRALEELDDRLSGNQSYLDRFLAAGEGLRERGMDAIEDFESVTREYMEYIMATMGHHGPTNELSQKLFSADDWVYMAGITDEDMAREAQLFDQVTATTPATLELPDS